MMIMMTVLLLLLITDNVVTGGDWVIGPDPAPNLGGVRTEAPAGDQWPHQVRAWQYGANGVGWKSDAQLTVTGNINIL